MTQHIKKIHAQNKMSAELIRQMSFGCKQFLFPLIFTTIIQTYAFQS
jgi:hypothetical protein